MDLIHLKSTVKIEDYTADGGSAGPLDSRSMGTLGRRKIWKEITTADQRFIFGWIARERSWRLHTRYTFSTNVPWSICGTSAVAIELKVAPPSSSMRSKGHEQPCHIRNYFSPPILLMFTNNPQLRIKASPMGLKRFKMSEEVDMVHEDDTCIGIIGLSTAEMDGYKSSMDEDPHERQNHTIKIFGIYDPSVAQGINKAKQASKPRRDNTVSIDWDGLWLSTVQCR